MLAQDLGWMEDQCWKVTFCAHKTCIQLRIIDRNALLIWDMMTKETGVYQRLQEIDQFEIVTSVSTE